MGKKPYILWFDEIGLSDLPIVGGKNASLGEMRKELTKQGVNVPNGFAVTVNAYHAFSMRALSRTGMTARTNPRLEKA
ncbi:MAG TPA: PEP/pyruvate-binding domain-containing protein, partial [Thermodesulfobacteriota bacterium]|nr:PEP/pyruvate-binding domain-containing protein [Thermodesulfobacteriota bacterium]